jgi:dihydroneopterin aldolase
MIFPNQNETRTHTKAFNTECLIGTNMWLRNSKQRIQISFNVVYNLSTAQKQGVLQSLLPSQAKPTYVLN